MRPEVNAGPIERRRSPLNVGVDIGSRGVGDASGVGVALAVGEADGDGDGEGDGEGCCAKTFTDRTNSESKDSILAHVDLVIGKFPLVLIGDTDYLDQCNLCFRNSTVRRHASAAASSS